MKYQLTFNEFISEAINPERITELKDKITNLTKRLGIETYPSNGRHTKAKSITYNSNFHKISYSFMKYVDKLIPPRSPMDNF